jgi:hypothetical protein
MSVGTIFYKNGLKYKVELNSRGKMYEAIILVWVWTRTEKGIEQWKWVKLNSLSTYQSNLSLVKDILLDSLPEGA